MVGRFLPDGRNCAKPGNAIAQRSIGLDMRLYCLAHRLTLDFQESNTRIDRRDHALTGAPHNGLPATLLFTSKVRLQAVQTDQ